MTDSFPENPKAEKDGHFDDRLGARWLRWMVRIAPVFQNKGYVVSAMDQTDVSHMREKATGIALDSVQMAHLEGEKTPADKSKGPTRPLS